MESKIVEAALRGTYLKFMTMMIFSIYYIDLIVNQELLL